MKLFGLLGYPMAYSFSKPYFEEKFAAEKLANYRFELFRLQNITGFPLLISENNFSGLAVTIPHKQTVIPFLSSLDKAAKEIGAVNCIQFSGKKLIGHNTDAIGFEKSFLPLLQPHHNKALVLGTGGAAKAVTYILMKNGIDFLSVSRNKAAANTITYNDIDEVIMKNHTVIINCTPVGTNPYEDVLPALPYQFLTENHYLYDLLYSPAKTKFLKEGEEHGARIKNGMEMLVLQAEENWRIWNLTM